MNQKTADLRARERELRGATAVPDGGWYPWISQALLRFGRERPARDVLSAFLGRRLSPAALLSVLHDTAERYLSTFLFEGISEDSDVVD